MKLKIKLKTMVSIICFLAGFLLIQFFYVQIIDNCAYAVTDEAITAEAIAPPKDVTILFTHDVHSNLSAFSKTKTAIDKIKSVTLQALLVDGGDFSMGTLYQTIFETNATELRALGKMGYDAVTIGNHEFDYRLKGLTKMFNSALSFNEPLPQVFLSNVDWTSSSSKDAKKFKSVMDKMKFAEYKIYEKNGVKIAVFGLLGREAISYAPLSGLVFDDYLGKAKKIVAEIKEKEDVDLIVCLSHTGTNKNHKKSEDHILARNVPGIDVIISAHSHTFYREPCIEGDTVIGSVGSNGKRLGKIELKITEENKNRKVELIDYEAIPLSSDTESNAELDAFINDSKIKVKDEFLAPYGYDFDQIIAYNPYRFTPYVNFAEDQDEYPLGNIVADSYIHAVKQAEGEKYEKVDVAFVSSGVVRASLRRGNISVSDVFKVSSLGIGADGTTGYPLVSGYLTGKELKTLAEVDASISTLMPSVKLYMSGMTYTFNPNRMLLNRVVDVNLQPEAGVDEEIEDDKLYRVVTGLYSTQMLDTLEEKSKGLMKVSPKDKDGKAIKDFEKHILYNDTGELKEWLALAHYLESFEQINGIPTIPDIYKDAQGRKVVAEKNDVVSVVSNPNKFTLIFMGIVSILAVIIIVSTALIGRHIYKKRKKKKADKIDRNKEHNENEQHSTKL